MAAHKFSLGSVFGTVFWLAGALALMRLSWSAELGDLGQRFAFCIFGTWMGTALGRLYRHPGRGAVGGLLAGVAAHFLAGPVANASLVFPWPLIGR